MIALVGSAPMRRLDTILYDRVSRWNAPPIDDRLLIVAIDNESLRRLGPWPWPRDLHARLIDRLRAAGVKAIAYDALFVDPAPDDAALGTAMKEGPPTFVPLLFEAPGRNGAAVDMIPPVEPVGRGAAGVGHVNVEADGNGLVRHVSLDETRGPRPVPHLMELAYRMTTGHVSPGFVRFAGTGAVLIPYTDRPGAFPTVPFAAVLAGEVPAAFLRGKTVLVGATASGMGDRYATPLSGGEAMPGVEIQANLLNGLLADRLIVPVKGWFATVLSLFPVWGLMLGFWRWSPAAALRRSVALLLAVPVASVALLIATDRWIAPGAAMAGVLLVYPLWGWRRLQAASDYVDDELARFAAERDLAIPARSRRGAGDLIEAQTARLAAAIDRIRDVRRFASDTVQGLPDPLLVTDLAGTVTLANSAAAALGQGDPVGSGADDWLAALAAAEGTDFTTRDGRRFAVVRAAFHDAAGEQRGWIVRLADISAIRAAEQAREEVLQLLSHDMRSPQASIITLVEQSGGAAPDADVSARIVRYARRTLALADNFVQLARIAATPFAPEPVALADVLAEAVDDAWVQAKQRAVRIVIDADPETPLVLGEPATLRRALSNLIDNAVSFSPAGGIVTCAVTLAGGDMRVSVADQGDGIAPERLPTLFDRFAFSVGSGRPSAGLGLAFVKATAERHGGTVTCASAPGHGATFTLALPVMLET